MEILIYVDEGVVERATLETPRTLAHVVDTDRHPIRTVDRNFFDTPGWERRTAAVVMPGGRDIPFHNALRGERNSRIRCFVEGGGAYIGFCAGAYFGARSVEFDRGHPLEVIGERELAFFPGAAVGPAYGPGTFSYESDTGVRAALISAPQDSSPSPTLRVFFNGGCFFKDAERFADIEILSHYEDIPDRPAAIIACRVGRGLAILSGVHPEYSPRSMTTPTGNSATVRAELSESDSARVQLLRALFKRANLTVVGAP